MKKSIAVGLAVVLCTVLFGCSSKSSTSGSSDKSLANAQTATEEAQADSEKTQSDSTLSQNSSSALKPSEDSSLKAPISMSSYVDSTKVLEFEGKIGSDLYIDMQLKPTTKTLAEFSDMYYNPNLLSDGKVVKKFAGTYYYLKYEQKINIEAYLYSNGYFSICEFDSNKRFNGSFGAFITTTKYMNGSWSDGNGNNMMPFYLEQKNTSLKNETIESQIKTGKTNVGEYKRINSNKDIGAYLTIPSEGGKQFKFHIEANWHAHIGNIDGVAQYTDDKKTQAKYHNDSDGAELTFTFQKDKINVEGNDVISIYGGANVELTGDFIK